MNAHKQSQHLQTSSSAIASTTASATRAILLALLLISSLFSPNSWAAVTANLSTSSLSFGSQTINTASPIQTVILSNTGTAPLILNSLVLGGANPEQFTLNSTPNNTANSISYVTARAGQTNVWFKQRPHHG